MQDREYYLKILEALAEKSTCSRKAVSAIILREKVTISTGYNGAPRKCAECADSKCLIEPIHGRETCIRTVHAEQNAIINAARMGIAINECIMVSLYKPCYNCMKYLINSGIIECYYFHDYEDRFQHIFEKNKHCKFIKIK